MGRWSILLAYKFLKWFDIPPGLTWLDVGCGTCSLTKVILDLYQPKKIIALDASGDYLSQAQRTINNPVVHFKIGLAQSLEIESGSVDCVVSGLALNFVPEPELAVNEMLRVTRPGGRIGIYIWDYEKGMQMLRYFWDAAVQLKDTAKEFDEAIRFQISREGNLEALVRAAGLKLVEAAPIEINTVFKDFDDYWQPFLGNVGPASKYTMSLDEYDRKKLEEKLRGSLPVDNDGLISLTAKAWAIKGKVHSF